MRRTLGLTILALFLCVSLSGAELLTPRSREEKPIAGMATHVYVDTFKNGAPAKVIISGNGVTCLGLYVFDREGNCVAHDDVSVSPATADDAFVEWVPPEQERYSIEIRNGGLFPNVHHVAIR